MVRIIVLPKSKFTVVDAEDYERLMSLSWQAISTPSGWYVCAPGGIWLHRVILGVTNSKVLVDHINRNGLDNKKSNLRLCTRAQNGMNRGPQKNSTTGYKGVTRNGSNFQAQITIAGCNKYLGTFSNPEDAARAYDEGARLYHKEFAYQNFGQ